MYTNNWKHFQPKPNPRDLQVLPLVTAHLNNGATLTVFPYVDSGCEGNTFYQAIRQQARHCIDSDRHVYGTRKE